MNTASAGAERLKPWLAVASNPLYPAFAILRLRRGEIVVIERIQVSRHRFNVGIAPAKPREGLPPGYLRFDTPPILGEFLVAPMYLGIVTGHAMRLVKQLAACRFMRRQFIGTGDRSEQNEGYEQYRFANHGVSPDSLSGGINNCHHQMVTLPVFRTPQSQHKSRTQ